MSHNTHTFKRHGAFLLPKNGNDLLVQYVEVNIFAITDPRILDFPANPDMGKCMLDGLNMS